MKRKWREKEKIERKWRGREKMERERENGERMGKWRERYFLPLWSSRQWVPPETLNYHPVTLVILINIIISQVLGHTNFKKNALPQRERKVLTMNKVTINSWEGKASKIGINPIQGGLVGGGGHTVSPLKDVIKLQTKSAIYFKKNYRTQVNLGSDLWVWMSVTHTPLWNLTDVTLADEETNSILTDNANRAIQGNVAMQVMQSGGQIRKQCKWRLLMTKIWTNPSCADCWPNLQLMQLVSSGGQICN